MIVREHIFMQHPVFIYLFNEFNFQILNKNIPILVKLNISTYFNPNKVWGNQLAGKQQFIDSHL